LGFLYSGRKPRILRILNTTCVIFGLLGLRVNFEFFLFLVVVVADYDVLVDVSALPGEKTFTLLFLRKNFLIIFIYVIGIKNLFESMVLI
jgi:hypothetical protein